VQQLTREERFMQNREAWFSCGAHCMRYLHLPAERASGWWWWQWRKPRPAVVFVHGLMGYSFSWRHNLDHFSCCHNVYAVDMLGVNHSDRPAPREADYGLAASAMRLLDFLQSLGESRVDLVATSHGGAVAMLAAALDSRLSSPKIHRMALIAPAHPFMPEAPLEQAMFHNPYGRSLMRGLISYSLQVQGPAMELMYADESRITPETREGYAVNFDDDGARRYATEVAMRWVQDKRILEEALPMIGGIPMLLLWGSEDRAVPPESAPKLMEVLRNAELDLLPGVGHLPYEEAPAAFNQRVGKFLES
jgi:4,5:9,10-diseco-3-hydroxy-5,9,17-trioxoandrosta-1(10),2-diene-4-oate hydrolase